MKKTIICKAIIGICLLSGHLLSALELGDTAPPLSIKNWLKGDAVILTEGKGKNIYVVEFWGSWCPPCRDSIPHLSDIQKKFKDKDVVVIGISAEDVDTVKEFINKMGDKMAYTVAVDNDGKTNETYMESFGVKGIPHAFIVDKDSKLVWHGHPMDGMEEVLTKVAAGKYDLDESIKKVEIQLQRETAQKLIDIYGYLVKELPEEKAIIKAFSDRIKVLSAGETKIMIAFALTILENESSMDTKLALELAETAYEIDGNTNFFSAYIYGNALIQVDRTKEGIKFFKEAVKLCPDDETKKNLQQIVDRVEGSNRESLLNTKKKRRRRR